MPIDGLGLSGCALYVPPNRVPLSHWCEWTGNSWDKIRQVVGHSFRMPGVDEDVYTMAGNAVLRLIRQFEVDPRQVGMLVLATESSTDNAAGAIIVKGLVNQALHRLGLPQIARACEVPEIKQACLAGIYALKSALRYVGLDGRGRQAIVVSSDIAAYRRGTSGEPTQGAGAVAQLVSAAPTLLEIDLATASASASDFRAVDFRKPFKRFSHPAYELNGSWHDFPVFNGRYSTACFVDEVRHAVDELARRRGMGVAELMAQATAIFSHRPYRKMTLDAVGIVWLVGMARAEDRRLAFDRLCAASEVDPALARDEADRSVDLLATVQTRDLADTAYPQLGKLLKTFQGTDEHRAAVAGKLTLGSDTAAQLGNLYAASLPAWIAAGLEEAAVRQVDLTGRSLLALGYGSGNAAEALLMKVVAGWAAVARRAGVTANLAPATDLTREQYEALHAGVSPALPRSGGAGFFIDRVGSSDSAPLEDVGVDYYAFVSGAS
jgi:hydroxymethylglutaryl-CoA synthase